MGAFRRAWHDFIWLCEELWLLCKHPTRERSVVDAKYHAWRIYDELIKHPWYALKRGIRNFWRWKGIIWKTDVYDHAYLLYIIDKQLEDMEKFWYSHKTHTHGARRNAKRITWTRKLLQMHQDEHYSTKNYIDMKDKHNIGNEWESEVAGWDDFGVPTMYKLVERRTPEQKEEYRVGMYKAIDMDEKVWKLFIKNLARCREWWD